MVASRWLASGGQADGGSTEAFGRRAPVDVAADALVVHDNAQMIATIEFALETRGFRVRVATSAGAAVMMLGTHRPDLVVMDTSATAIDVAALHREIRDCWPLPVILLTEGAHDLAGVIGIAEGAAGSTVSMAKPFHPRDLAERAVALSRRNIPRIDDVVQVGGLRIDQVRLTVTVNERLVDLPFTEFKLLTHLAVHRGTPQTWRTLLYAVWGAQTLAGGGDVVKSAVYRLRSRLAEAGAVDDYIVTLRGAGYLMPDLPPGGS